MKCVQCLHITPFFLPNTSSTPSVRTSRPRQIVTIFYCRLQRQITCTQCDTHIVFIWVMGPCASVRKFLACTFNFIQSPHLVHRGCPRKGRLAAQHFTENTPDCPYVDTFRVAWRTKQNLRGTIPTRCDIIGQMGLRACRFCDISAEAKVAKLHVAVAVEKQVAGLDIPV